jgi:hypothetical protein
MPARVGAAFPLLLVIAGCSASEPQLPCSDVFQKVYDVARQLDRDDREIMGTFTPEKAAEVCTRARDFVRRQKELQKLVRDNKDRCKEYDFRGANIGAFSIDTPGVANGYVESGLCK